MKQRAGNIAERLRAHWKLKMVLTFGLSVFFAVPYFSLQHVQWIAPRSLQLTVVDRWIGFQPGWVWIYQSAYLLMPLAPWLCVRRADLIRYARGFVFLSLAGFACFLLFPVQGPRPVQLPDHPMFQLLVSYDGTRNAFPSLHCALVLYAVLFGFRSSFRDAPPAMRHALVASAILWVGAIAFSTLATKQHYFVDVPAGLVLAAVCHWMIWNPHRLRSGARRWSAVATKERTLS